MIDTFPQAILLPAIRIGMGISREKITLNDSQLSDLYSFGTKQSILPIIWAGIENMDIPDDWRRKYELETSKCVRDYVLKDYSLGQICDTFHEASIPYIPLKGSALRDLYPEKYFRTSCDLDILVHEGNLERAVTLLEEKTDFISQHRNYHDVSTVSKQVHLELHFSIKENMDNIDSLLSQVWNYAEPTGEGSKYKLTPEYQIFHVIAHMSYHMVHGGLGIRPFIDLWLLRNKTTYDEATVREYCENCGILKFYETSCELSDSWLSNKLYTETTRALEEYCLKGGVFGNVELAGAGNQREFRGISYLFKRLFVSNNLSFHVFLTLKKG